MKQGRKKERGQASVMMGIMMLTFLFFFAFVVNTGMMVNAKINLQNAADLAAYAGASVQARQLNQISFLNYEMRRQYKKFLFRYYVLGNMAQCAFPGTKPNTKTMTTCQPPQVGGGGKTPMIWSPTGDPNKDYRAPVVCVIFNPRDNYCQLEELPKIVTPDSAGAFDDITNILKKYLKDIGKSQKANCVAVGLGNKLLLNTWLWNTDPDLKMIDEGLLDPKNFPAMPSGSENLIQQIFSVIRGLGRGLGLVPEEIILRRRIETLASYVNTEPLKNVTFDDVQQMKSRKIPEPPTFERTIQAFLSAYYTLGEHTFPAGEIQMDELMGKQLLKLSDNKVHFGAFAIDFPVDLNADPNASNCKPQAVTDSVSTPIPVGVAKDPSVLTYYAIRLKARATLMFSPFGDVQLKAYAAAQPFGSRIGPKLEENAWNRPSNINPTLLAGGGLSKEVDAIPNLPVQDGDSAGIGNGWDTQEFLLAMHKAFELTDGTMPNSIGPGDLDRAYHTAMAPNPGEPKKYNIHFDGDDPFVRAYDKDGILAFYAPVFPLSKGEAMNEELKGLMKQYWPGGQAEQEAMIDILIQRFSRYLELLRQGKGAQYEYGKDQTAQGFEIVRLVDPMRRRDGTNGVFTGPYNPPDPAKNLRTSWDDIRNGGLEKGRVGYSVKFVALEYLLNKRMKTDSAKGVMINSLDIDPEAEADLARIKH